VTTYKIQGDTLPAMVIANWRSKTKADRPEQGYVMVSRAKSRYNLICLEQISADDCDYFKPSVQCLNADKCLNILSKKTIAQFYLQRQKSALQETNSNHAMNIDVNVDQNIIQIQTEQPFQNNINKGRPILGNTLVPPSVPYIYPNPKPRGRGYRKF
jgi:hypothetical protein